MGIIIAAIKVLSTIFFFAFFIAGVFKADPRTHNPERRPFSEYTAGFLICTSSIIGIYYLWFN
jgi:hypothetical protein